MTRDLRLRQASSDDVPSLRGLLADDSLGAEREDLSDTALARYLSAFARIREDDRNELWVATLEERLVGMYQVTYIPYLSRGGNQRALIEAVRVASDLRSRGIGASMMQHAIDEAKARGCLLMQLTTDKTRKDAHRFYKRLGFEASHEGMKLDLSAM